MRRHIRGIPLPMPMDPLRCIGLVVHVNPYRLSNSRSQQRTGKVAVVSQGRDKMPGRQFNQRPADPQDVGWISLRCYSWCSVRQRLEARTDRSSA